MAVVRSTAQGGSGSRWPCGRVGLPLPAPAAAGCQPWELPAWGGEQLQLAGRASSSPGAPRHAVGWRGPACHTGPLNHLCVPSGEAVPSLVHCHLPCAQQQDGPRLRRQ